MHIVVVHNWQETGEEVAKTIAGTMGTLVFEARQKITFGGPAILTSFADPDQAETLSIRLSENGVPAFTIDPAPIRLANHALYVHRFAFEPQSLQLESTSGKRCNIDYDTIELLLVAMYSTDQTLMTDPLKKRKFSLKKPLLAGGVPMSKAIKNHDTVTVNERDETLRLYTSDQTTLIFDRRTLDYSGFGDAMQLTRDLNFNQLKTELRLISPDALYDERLLKRAGLIRLLGPTLSPDSDLELAFEILAQSLRANSEARASSRELTAG